jgi:large subunit ribosomal protein L1
MPKHGKKYTAAAQTVEDRLNDLPDAVAAVRKAAFAKFDETVEASIRLGVDPKHADQMVRGTVVLPHGTGKTKRLLVFASGEKIKEAETAGADYVGGADFVKKIQDGWMEFEAVVATPDMMREVGKLGKILGPRGMMPNPKTGTVTFDVAQAVGEIKAGRVEFRVDKTGIVHVPVGKLSFEDAQIVENIRALLEAVLRARPAAAKGKYVKSFFLASTMGPGVPVDAQAVEATVA